MLSETRLLKEFADPASEYRPQPFWFINHEVDKDEIVREVRMMHEKGVGGFIFHARHGLGDAFMTPVWLDALAVACREADKLGMVAWLYDEDNWPSGTMGGRLTAAYPEYRMRYLRYWEQRIDGPCETVVSPEMDDNEIFQVLLTPLVTKKGRLEPVCGLSKDLTSAFDSALGNIRVKVSSGKHLLSFFFICPVPQGVTFRNGSYLDTLDREACIEFVRCCYEPNIKAVEPYLGKTVRGIFTDEPGLMIHDGFFGSQSFRPTLGDPKRRLPGYVMPWSRRFAEMFRKWRGYDLVPHLLSLVYERSPEDLKVRQDYYQTATDAYVRHYYGAIRKFTVAHGLKLIGHTLEEPIWAQVRSQGNQHKVLAQYDIPGYDYLFMGGGIATAENPSRLLAAQCAYSVAALKGGERIMVEAFGGSGNGATLAERRRHANMMALMGTSLFVPHAFYMSYAGERKADFPPCEFYHAPSWEHYDYFSAYLGRISMLAHAGSPVSPVMVLSPIHTAYRQIAEDGKLKNGVEADTLFSRLSYDLMSRQRSHIYIDEEHLVRAKIEEDAICLNDYIGKVSVLIVPGATVLLGATVEFLQRFLKSGGRIIWIGGIPSVTSGGEAIPRKNLSRAGSILLEDYEIGRLAAMLDERQPLPIKVRCRQGDELLALVKKVESSFLLMVFNPSETRKVHADILLGIGKWSVEKMDPETGKIVPCDEGFDIDPSELRCFLIRSGVSSGRMRERCEKKPAQGWITVRASGFERANDNLLPLDRWTTRLSVPSEEFLPVLHSLGHSTAVCHSASVVVRDVPGRAMLLLDDLRQELPPHYGVLCGYRNLEIAVNGKVAPPCKRVDWPDHYFTGTDISDLLKKGENAISLYIAQSNERPPMPSLQYPMMLCGNFGVGPDDELTSDKSSAITYWDESGSPLYSGSGSYFFSVPLANASKELWMDLGDVRESASIIVNGETAATRAWPPFTIKVRAPWRRGVNRVEVRVANTLSNLWDRIRRKSGMQGKIRINTNM